MNVHSRLLLSLVMAAFTLLAAQRSAAAPDNMFHVTDPDFLENGVPTMGFYGPFAPAVQIYSCHGSVYWIGKAFLGLLLPEGSEYWSARENRGPWDGEMRRGQVYNRLQEATGLMITNYPNSGSSEMRSWCHESVAADWQKFRSSENYNKLAYNTAFIAAQWIRRRTGLAHRFQKCCYPQIRNNDVMS